MTGVPSADASVIRHDSVYSNPIVYTSVESTEPSAPLKDFDIDIANEE